MKPAGSMERVEQAAREAGLGIEIRRMGASTRTAQEAARQCGCAVGQIVKSLVFQGEHSGRLYLFLVSGAHQLDLGKAAALTAEPLVRADPRRVRDETGFAIGGVAPIGHRIAIAAYADEVLLGYDRVWAAAGAHDAVFAAEPSALVRAAAATAADLATGGSGHA
jgi:prolyl-tRNA editing enzyme YbaK/EbsC (Cys-tRNA(Pro) deacylase)